MKKARLAVEDLLAAYSPEVRALSLQTRAFLLKIIPKAVEEVGTRPAIIGYGFSSKYADLICTIMPAKARVTLGIAHGTELPDPENLMEGAGKVHRHVKIRTNEDLRNPALKALLHAAVSRWKKNKKAKTA